MENFKFVTPDFATCGQISFDDLPKIVAAGFKTLINNRPDLEGGLEQPKSQLLEEKAKELGLNYWFFPVISGQMTIEQVEIFKENLPKLEGPILAFCRSGARSTQLWALAKELEG